MQRLHYLCWLFLLFGFHAASEEAANTPNDPENSRVWGYHNTGQPLERSGSKGTPHIDLDLQRAWQISTGSKDVIVAIVDTGIDLTHPDLIDNLWVNTAELNGQPGVDDDHNGYVDDVHGYDFENNDSDPQDDNGHGSHIAGIIGAKGNNGLGISGINWNVQMMAVKYLNSTMNGDFQNAAKAIHYAIDNGARIINCSWGETENDHAELREAFARARRESVLMVVAAGNDYYDLQHEAFYPAWYRMENQINVMAINNQAKPWFTNGFGTNYGTDFVDIAAPGEDVVSYYPTKGLTPLSGTSMAAPFVSGVAALVLAKNPELSAAELKHRILKYSAPHKHLRKYNATKGIVNAYHALAKIPAPRDLDDPSEWAARPHALQYRKFPANHVERMIITMPGAKRLAVHFKKFFLESKDRVLFFDQTGAQIGRWTGNHKNDYSPIATGDSLILELHSDSSLQMGGLWADELAFQML